MNIGFKGLNNSNETNTQNTEPVESNSTGSSTVRDDLSIEHENSKEPSAHPTKGMLIGGVALVLIVVLVGYALSTMQSKNKDVTDVSDNVTTENTQEAGNTDESTQESMVVDVSSQSTTTETTESSENTENPNAVYDDSGNLISENGIYDEDGNVISKDEDVIDVGLPDYNHSDNNTTTATVYSASDYIKDLNGVTIPAIYNVKSRDYIKDFVNYEAKRAIIDDGMELYWLEVSYNEKKYRVQVPFYIFKDLNKTGICAVEIEVLTLQGGEKVISYMQVVTDYSTLER